MMNRRERTNLTSLHVNLTLSSFHPIFFLPLDFIEEEDGFGFDRYREGRLALLGVDVVKSIIRS